MIKKITYIITVLVVLYSPNMMADSLDSLLSKSIANNRILVAAIRITLEGLDTLSFDLFKPFSALITSIMPITGAFVED